MPEQSSHDTDTVAVARRAMGRVGAILPVTFTETPSYERQLDAVRRLDRAGYGCLWTNEVLGKDAMVQLALLLGATERITFGTGIANVWVREPQTASAAAASLAQAHPGRFVLGLGVGYPEQAAATGRTYGRPLQTLRTYLQRMDEPSWPPAPDADYPRLIAANGPKMLALAAEIADGAMPAGLPAAFTAQARRILGPDKLLAVGLSVVPDADADRARNVARQTVAASLNSPSYAAAVAGLGFSDGDVAEVGDRLVDAVVGHGPPAAIVETIRGHLAAGADHVMLLPPIGDFAAGVAALEVIGPALAALG